MESGTTQASESPDGSLDESLHESPNEDTIKYLRAIATYYKILGRKADEHRTRATYAAAKLLASIPHRIDTKEEALQYHGIGESLAQTIHDFAMHGKTTKLDALKAQAGEAPHYIDLFTQVYGIGPATAWKLYSAGYRTIESIPESELTRAQRVGRKYLKEINTRLQRSEVASLYGSVHDAVHLHVKRMEPVGSYRRGASTSGDIDILMSTSKGSRTTLRSIVDALHNAGVLLEDLALGPTKYSGLTANPIRRIDIRLIDDSVYACALLYFTGSEEFNVSIRQRAKTMSMKLSEYYLTFVYDQTHADVQEEYHIFAALDMPYIPPTERNKEYSA